MSERIGERQSRVRKWNCIHGATEVEARQGEERSDQRDEEEEWRGAVDQ